MKDEHVSDNLPNWIGADGAYRRSYRILANMAKRGHVTQSWWRGRCQCSVSDEMESLIDALNEGDEEKVKGLNLSLASYA